jgi:hypothetical protein
MDVSLQCMLAHKQPLRDVDTQSDKSKDESENVDTTCNSCNNIHKDITRL